MNLPILYSFRRCPYAMRARLALLASGISCELREVALRDKPEELLAASPKGTVPVLITPAGQVIDQSLDIMLWALRQNDPLNWLRPEVGRLEDALALIARCDGEFKHQLDRYKYPQRFAGADRAASQAAAALFAADLNARLSLNSYLFGSYSGLSDAGIMPFIRQFAHVDAAWFAAQPWPQLQAGLAVFEASEGFTRAMQPCPVWRSGASGAVFS
ncbi:MAG: glutathione S-transferase N-terminal domain-containing protein [Burkholderiaceae bacterium]|nr:glutathione S-transferase N-terminal domain-containing protein [Burkholderiaceae bacterium]